MPRLPMIFVWLTVLGVGATVSAVEPDLVKVEFFEKKVRPIFNDRCAACHSADTNAKGGLRVDDRNSLLQGGNSGPAVVPGDPDKSNLVKRITATGKGRMPADGGDPLSEEQIAALKQWIRDGAAWPELKLPDGLGTITPEYIRLRKEHWAWQPLTNPPVPSVSDEAWPRGEIDRFVLAKLEAKKLRPVRDAEKSAWIRRVTFDLIGLPPSPEQIDDFLCDDQPNADKRVVDRLLASPQFGERWGRYWLDVARYGESTGPSRNVPYPHAWRYRDYVIDAMNAGVPFDRFIREQIAGDLLPSATPAERDRLQTATGFLALGPKDVNQRFKARFDMDNADEQIDTVSRSFLAMTVSCARCHDHKFDPIPTTDYYALAGIFTSTDNCAGVRNKMGGSGLAYYDRSMLIPLTNAAANPVDPDKVASLKAKFDSAKQAWNAIRGTPEGLKKDKNGQNVQRPYRLRFEKAQSEFAEATDPAARAGAVHGVRDARVVGDTQIRIRGEAEKLGPVVPRGFLSAFDVPGAAKVNPRQSGRLELADWLASPNNPLTARVIVNRVWHQMFGRGIVSTVDNFGTMGDVPSHPELLDRLADRFILEGWSIKTLVREIALSRTYALSTESSPAERAADPENALLWRHSPRRLDAEQFRDAVLAASGVLDLKRPEASPAKELRMVEIRDNGPEARTLREKADLAAFRSVYLPLVRGLTPHALEAFDPVEQTLVTGARDATTVPGQSLFLLNSPFVRKQSLTMVERLLREATDAKRIELAYRLTIGRKPTALEIDRAVSFVTDYEHGYRPAMVAESKPVAPANAKAEKPAVDVIPANPDEIDQTGEVVAVETVVAKDGKSAAWLAFAQALFASAEFRYLP